MSNIARICCDGKWITTKIMCFYLLFLARNFHGNLCFIGLPLNNTPIPATVPGSTAATTVAPLTATHSSLPQQLSHPSTYNVAQPLANPLEPANATPNVLPTNAVLPSQPLKLKKGVKRKADTTTPGSTYDYSNSTSVASKSAKISTRRESGRQIKKPMRSEIDGLVPYHPNNMAPMVPNATITPQHASHKSKEKLSEGLKACNEILKELFAKKHFVSNIRLISIF